ncbi:MAG: N-formylglutamate amidohydrolase [Pseudomonadota bacterium]
MADPDFIAGDDAARLLILADHASTFVPAGIDLGLLPDIMSRHVAVDIGTAALASGVAAQLRAPAIVAGASRLVVDLNRPADDPAAIPVKSDDIEIAGNRDLNRTQRAERRAIHDRYHDMIEDALDEMSPDLILSLHSFTPSLASAPEDVRPWQAGLLYDRDDRAARIAIAWLRAEGLTVGDNEPYSGARFGYTMQRHAEPRGIPYLFLEIRQDLLPDDAGIADWTARVAALVRHTQDPLAKGSATDGR